MATHQGITVCDHCKHAIPEGQAVRSGAYVFCASCVRLARGGIEASASGLAGIAALLVFGGCCLILMGGYLEDRPAWQVRSLPWLVAGGTAVAGLLLVGVIAEIRALRRQMAGAKK